MFRITVDPDLRARWQPIVERQVDMTLSPLRASLKSGRVDFGLNVDGDEGGIYWCKVRGAGVRGESFEATARHTDGLIAIVDAMARARRAIARRRQRPMPLR